MKGSQQAPENQDDEDLKHTLYWLSKTPKERLAEVTRLIRFDLKPGQTMDKTHVVKTKLHPGK